MHLHIKRRKIRTKAVIIANGLKRRLLGCEGEKEFNGKGVSYCATCDGAFFKDKSVIIVGGGNTAIEDALYLSNISNYKNIVKVFKIGIVYSCDYRISCFNLIVNEIGGNLVAY